MAEVIGLVASIVAVIQISERILGLVKRSIRSAKDAPKDIRIMMNEISMIKAVFENLHFLAEVDVGTSELLQKLKGPDGPIEGCRESISALEKLIEDPSAHHGARGDKKKIKPAIAILTWPLKATKAQRLLEDLSRYKMTINLALASETS